jgi:hypothetical protein
VHPDANPDIAEAGDIMAMLNTLHDLAQKKLTENMWGKSSITITFDKNRTITDVEPFSKGDVGDIYKGMLDGKTVVIKVGTSAADLIKTEATTLKKMYESKDIKNFGKYLPKLIDTIKVNGKLANIFEYAPKTFTLEQVLQAYPDGLWGMDSWTNCELYNIDQDPNKGCTDAEALLWAQGDTRTTMLSSVVPFSTETSADEHNVIRHIESYADVPVVIKSTGPTAKNKVSLL